MRQTFLRAAIWLSLVVAPVACNSTESSPKRAHVEIDPKETLHFLASDDLEGRGIGTAGLDRAADFIADEYRQIGLKPLPRQKGYFQTFSITTATAIGSKTSLRSGDRNFSTGEDFAPLSFSGEGEFAGAVVFAGYGMSNNHHGYDDYAGLDVKGKVVLAMRYQPHNAKGESRLPTGVDATLALKAKTAQAHGAVALMLVTPPTYHGPDTLLPFARRIMGESGKIPVIHLRMTAAEELLKRGGVPDLKTLQAKIDNKGEPASLELADVQVSGAVQIDRKKSPVKNVVGYIPGKRKNEFVVVGAHYDHLGRGGISTSRPRQPAIHNGADDNASGTTALLKLASRLASGPTPERSIIFAAFTAEEQGLLGSAHFVEHPPIPLAKITAMFNLDMVGRVRNETIFVGGTGTAQAFDAIVKQADQASPLQLKDFGKGGLGPSDHMSFALKKIPVLFLFSGLHNDYHRPTDDSDKINYEGLNQVIDLAGGLIRQIASLPRQPYIDSADAASTRMSTGSGSRVTLGVVPDYSEYGSTGGVRISGTSPGSPAAAAGLKAGDVIVKFGDQTIDSLYDLSDALAKAKAGQKVKLQITRDKAPLELEATLAERKD